MKQVYLQISDEENVPLSHEYDLDVGYLFTTLKYSGSSIWADDIIGTIAASIQDTGDGLILKINGMKQVKLDYSQALQVLILLLNNAQDKLEIRESKLIKSI
jgi:hypothetical protein